MIEDDFKFANPLDDPRICPPARTPGLVEKLEAQGFRPFGYEW